MKRLDPHLDLILEDRPDEEWRDVVGYDGYYSVSNNGRIRSESRMRNGGPNGQSYLIKRRILKQVKNYDKELFVVFSVDAKRKIGRIATVVADAFLRERVSGEVVMHYNKIYSDNTVGNLKIVTQSESSKRNHELGIYQLGKPQSALPTIFYLLPTSTQAINQLSSTKEISLLNGRGTVIVDEEYFNFISQWDWCATTERTNGVIDVYRGITRPTKRNIFLKRLLMANEIEAYAKKHSLPVSLVCVNCINNNTLDLRKENLQVGGRDVVAQNIRPTRFKKRGIWYCKRLKGYLVKIASTVNGKKKVGIVETELEAMNLWNHWRDEVFDYCHFKYECEYIPLENIKIRKRDPVKQASQVRSIQHLSRLAMAKKAKYYTWNNGPNQAFCVVVKGKFFGYFKGFVAWLLLDSP